MTDSRIYDITLSLQFLMSQFFSLLLLDTEVITRALDADGKTFMGDHPKKGYGRGLSGLREISAASSHIHPFNCKITSIWHIAHRDGTNV